MHAAGRRGKGIGQIQTNDGVNKAVVCDDAEEFDEDINQVQTVDEEIDDGASGSANYDCYAQDMGCYNKYSQEV